MTHSFVTEMLKVDSFLISDPSQVKVEYMFLQKPSNLAAIPAFAKKVFTPADLRTIKTAWNAESHFFKMQSPQGNIKKIIKSVTVIQNSKLLAAFEEKRKHFLANKIPANPIY